MIGMGCVIYLLVSPQAWVHYYVLTLPMLIAAFRPWTQEPAHAGLTVILFRFMPLVVLLAFLNGPHWYLFSGEYHLVRGGGNVVALLILYVLGLWQLWFRNDR